MNNSAPTLVCVVGARPNFMKIAPIMRVLRRQDSGIRAVLVHTGQHYDEAMNRRFFEDLAIPQADMDLGVGSGSHAVQTAEIMRRFEPVLDAEHPDAVLVVGDVNSTIACALVAVKRGVPVVHVEAGLRSGDRSMPEEINRVLTDQISELLFTTERGAAENLCREGVKAESVHFVGNVMIDTVRFNLERAVAARETLTAAGFPASVGASGYGVLTLHRPSNVDSAETLGSLLGLVTRISERLPMVFPVHPRTKARIDEFGLDGLLAGSRVLLLPPAGYLEMLGLLRDARLVLTDSGGIQEETTALGVPCLTLRDNTERPITVREGTNTVVGTDPERIAPAVDEILAGGGKKGRTPELWDGRAAERIGAVLRAWMGRPMDEAAQAAGSVVS